MTSKVKLSKDGSSIDFVPSESVPTSVKKFRQSPEIEGFYRFIFENDLQREVYDILDRIIALRKEKKSAARKEAKAQAAAAHLLENPAPVKKAKKAEVAAPAPKVEAKKAPVADKKVKVVAKTAKKPAPAPKAKAKAKAAQPAKKAKKK